VCLAAQGCGGDDTSDDKKDGVDGGGTETKQPEETVKHPGPCTTDFTDSKGKLHKGYVTRTWDSKKRLVLEKTADFAESVNATRWTHEWTYGGNDKLLKEKFETSSDEPNFEWAYEYDAKGRLAKKVGNKTGWTRATCTVEYNNPGGKLSAHICLWELDETDDDGKVTGTTKGKSYVIWKPGNKQRTEEHQTEGNSEPDKVIVDSLDDNGNVIKRDIYTSTASLPDKTIKHSYDAKGRLVKTEIDEDADDQPNEIQTRTWDTPGNLLTVGFDDDADGKPNWIWHHNYACWAK